MGSVPPHEPSTSQLHEDYLFCHELLEADVGHFEASLLSPLPCNCLQGITSNGDNGGICGWSCYPTQLWSSHSISISSNSMVQLPDHLHEQKHCMVQLHDDIPHEQAHINGCCCCPESSITSSSPSLHQQCNVYSHGELGSGDGRHRIKRSHDERALGCTDLQENPLIGCMSSLDHEPIWSTDLSTSARSCGKMRVVSACASGHPATTNHENCMACESMAVLLERQQWSHCTPLKGYVECMLEVQQSSASISKRKETRGFNPYASWPASRRRSVEWILQAGKVMHVRISTIAQAVAYLDRYLSNQMQAGDQHNSVDDFHVAGAACLWIALKIDHSDAPDAPFIQSLAGIYHDEGAAIIKAMEASILRALEWRMLGVSVVDFVDSILESLQAYSCGAGGLIPKHLIKPLQSRAYEIMQGILLEVIFVGYEASLVGICVIQYVLEELLPLQAASLLHSIHKTLAPIDMEAASECYKAMGDLVVDPVNVHLSLETSSPDRVLPATLIL